MTTALRGKPGREPSLIADDRTLATVEGLAKIQCTQAEAAAVLGCSRDTFHEFFKSDPDIRACWDNGPESGRASLRRNQFKLSEKNAAMAIWLGKQYLGQRDPDRASELHPGKKQQARLASFTAGAGADWGDDLEVTRSTRSEVPWHLELAGPVERRRK
jgi:hypothetical protein